MRIRPLAISFFNSAFCILHFAFCILHFAFCILHSAFCILHSAFCILHWRTLTGPYWPLLAVTRPYLIAPTLAFRLKTTHYSQLDQGFCRALRWEYSRLFDKDSRRLLCMLGNRCSTDTYRKILCHGQGVRHCV